MVAQVSELVVVVIEIKVPVTLMFLWTLFLVARYHDLVLWIAYFVYLLPLR